MHTGISTIRDLILAAALAGAGHASAAPATHYAFTLPDPEPFYTSTYVYVTALDDTNAVDTSYAGTAVVTSSDPGLAVIGPLTFAAGVLEFHIAFKKAGLQSVTLTDNANASITGTASTTVSPGPPTHFSVDGAAPVAGAAMPFTVNARDLFNNLATSYAGTVHITSSDAQATLPADFAITAGTGAASATFRTSLAQTLTVTDTADAGMTGTGNFTVAAGPATHLALTLPATVDAGAPFNFDVMAKDAFENSNASYAGTLHFTSSDAGATLPADSTLSNGQGTFSATLQVAHSNTSITATDTVDASLTGTGRIATTPVTLQSFEVD